MKISTFLIGAAAVVLSSCSQQSYPTQSPSPFPSPYPRDAGVIVNDDGRVISRDGRVAGNQKNLPPGQAKKIYGGKSAKPYAPGQRKKMERTGTNLPPRVITIDDRYAQRDVSGRYYYVNSDAYIYWRSNDGRYYLDEKYLQSGRQSIFNDDDQRKGKLKGKKNGKAKGKKG